MLKEKVEVKPIDMRAPIDVPVTVDFDINEKFASFFDESLASDVNLDLGPSSATTDNFNASQGPLSSEGALTSASPVLGGPPVLGEDPVAFLFKNNTSEMDPIQKLFEMHSHKPYIKGYLYRKVELGSDGKKPVANQEDMELGVEWSKWWYELKGRFLQMWRVPDDMAGQSYRPRPTVEKIISMELQPHFRSIEIIKEKNPIPVSMNIIDAVIEILPVSFLPALNPDAPLPPTPYTNYIALSNSGSNLFLFAFPSIIAANTFAAAVTLSSYEVVKLSQYFTLTLLQRSAFSKVWVEIGVLPNQTRNCKDEIVYENDFQVRFPYSPDWKEYRIMVTSKKIDYVEQNEKQSSIAAKLFGGKKKKADDTGAKKFDIVGSDFSQRGQIVFYQVKKDPMNPQKKERGKAVYQMPLIDYVYAVWPEKVNMIDMGIASIAKVEGKVYPVREDEDMIRAEKVRMEPSSSDKKKKDKESADQEKASKVDESSNSQACEFGGISSLLQMKPDSAKRKYPEFALMMASNTLEMLRFVVSVMAAFNLESDAKERALVFDNKEIGLMKIEVVEEKKMLTPPSDAAPSFVSSGLESGEGTGTLSELSNPIGSAKSSQFSSSMSRNRSSLRSGTTTGTSHYTESISTTNDLESLAERNVDHLRTTIISQETYEDPAGHHAQILSESPDGYSRSNGASSSSSGSGSTESSYGSTPDSSSYDEGQSELDKRSSAIPTTAFFDYVNDAANVETADFRNSILTVSVRDESIYGASAFSGQSDYSRTPSPSKNSVEQREGPDRKSMPAQYEIIREIAFQIMDPVWGVLYLRPNEVNGIAMHSVKKLDFETIYLMKRRWRKSMKTWNEHITRSEASRKLFEIAEVRTKCMTLVTWFEGIEQMSGIDMENEQPISKERMLNFFSTEGGNRSGLDGIKKHFEDTGQSELFSYLMRIADNANTQELSEEDSEDTDDEQMIGIRIKKVQLEEEDAKSKSESGSTPESSSAATKKKENRRSIMPFPFIVPEMMFNNDGGISAFPLAAEELGNAIGNAEESQLFTNSSMIAQLLAMKPNKRDSDGPLVDLNVEELAKIYGKKETNSALQADGSGGPLIDLSPEDLARLYHRTKDSTNFAVPEGDLLKGKDMEVKRLLFGQNSLLSKREQTIDSGSDHSGPLLNVDDEEKRKKKEKDFGAMGLIGAMKRRDEEMAHWKKHLSSMSSGAQKGASSPNRMSQPAPAVSPYVPYGYMPSPYGIYPVPPPPMAGSYPSPYPGMPSPAGMPPFYPLTGQYPYPMYPYPQMPGYPPPMGLGFEPNDELTEIQHREALKQRFLEETRQKEFKPGKKKGRRIQRKRNESSESEDESSSEEESDSESVSESENEVLAKKAPLHMQKGRRRHSSSESDSEEESESSEEEPIGKTVVIDKRVSMGSNFGPRIPRGPPGGGGTKGKGSRLKNAYKSSDSDSSDNIPTTSKKTAAITKKTSAAVASDSDSDEEERRVVSRPKATQQRRGPGKR